VKRALTAATAAVLAVACGGRTAGDGDGGLVDSGDGSLLGDGLIGDANMGDASWTLCSSPDGYMVCGGTDNCNAGTSCAQFCSPALGNNELEPCNGTTGNLDNTCDSPDCPDGYLCLRTDGVQPTDAPLLGNCVNDEIAHLFHLNGGDARLLYADYSFFDGTPLPTPATCPQITGLALCGGACGDTCPKDDGGFSAQHVCFGRSKTHPFSLCAAVGGECTAADPSNCIQVAGLTGTPQGCLVFLDNTASQANADPHGFCVPQDTCNAAAQGYPGGAKCTPVN
jgi:hypothetical protein